MRTIYSNVRIQIANGQLEKAYESLMKKYPQDDTLILLKMQFVLCEKQYSEGLISFDTYRICINSNVKALLTYLRELERSYLELNSKQFIFSITR